jgi:hypothetical protein
VVALKTNQVAALTTAQVVAMTSDQVAALETADVAALKTNQVAALKTNQVTALTTDQVVALKTANIAVLSTNQVRSLTTDQMSVLNTSQVSAFTTVQVCKLTTSQIGAISTSAVSSLRIGSPIVLDLNGDGVRTQSISNGVTFDLFANGKNINTGWVSSSDGLLVMDRNHDGAINDGTELFGEATKLSDGSTAKDGYVALREMDSNQDGVIDQNDEAFADLKVWVDANSDGGTQTGELKTLQELNISSISAVADVNLSMDNGNLIGLTSSYQTTDGATHAAADVWFVADKFQDVPVLTDVVMSAPEATALSTDLRSQVSNMAQAIGTYVTADALGTGVSSMQAIVGGTASQPATQATLAVGSMVSVMQQFDANGNSVTSSTLSAPPVNGLNLSGSQTATSAGVLASAVNKPSSS